jgi:hypothetical protein
MLGISYVKRTRGTQSCNLFERFYGSTIYFLSFACNMTLEQEGDMIYILQMSTQL